MKRQEVAKRGRKGHEKDGEREDDRKDEMREVKEEGSGHWMRKQR